MKKTGMFIIIMVTLLLAGCESRTTVQNVASNETESSGLHAEESSVDVFAEVTENSEESEATETLIESSEETGETEEAEEAESKETDTAETKREDATGKSQDAESKEAVSAKQVERQTESEPQTSTARQPSASQNNTGSQSAPNPSPDPATPHSCTWDGGQVTTAATCNSEGVRTFTCTGCGNTKTESIAKTSHNYITENIPATCTEAGKTKTYCSICGDVQSEETGEAATGHTPGGKVYWPETPTCTHGGYYNISCSKCGEHLESGSDPVLSHTEVATETRHGNCVVDTVISYDCSVCGAHIRTDSHTEPNDHDWVAGSGEVWDPETHSVVTITGYYCSRCGASKQN